MAIRRRPVMQKKPKPPDETKPTGIFTGTAQAGPARPQRAHALAEELLARGCLYIQNQVFDEAAREFRKAIKMDETYAEAYNNLGLCLLYANKIDEAIENFQLALQYFPNWHLAQANLALALQRVNRLEEAADCYQRSLQAKKNQPTVWLALGDVYSVMGHTDDALNTYRTAVELSPRYDLAYQRIGMIEARRNNIDEAEANLRKAIAIDPDLPDALAVLGAICARRGLLQEAGDFFAQVEGLEKVPAPAQKGIQRLEIARSGLLRAFDEWKTNVPETPSRAVCWYNLGLAQFKANNESGAREAFQNAADAQPDWPEPIIWFGFFAAMEGDAVNARKYWDQAVQLEPDNGMLREQLGYLALAMGLQKEADAHFKEALRLGRDIPKEDLKPDA